MAGRRVRGLRVESEPAGFAIEVPTIAIDGYALSPSGTFAAATVSIPAASLEAGPFTVAISDATFKDVMLPTTGGFTWDTAEPVAATFRALAPLTRIGLSSARIGALILTETFEGVRSRTAYTGVAIDGWQGNRIARTSAKSLTSEAPSPSPFITLSAADAETRDIDLAALLDAVDPTAKPGAPWRTAVGHIEESDFTIGVGKLSARVGKISLDNLGIRPPQASPSEPANAAPPSPLDAALGALDALSGYRVGRLAIDDAALAISQSDQIKLAHLTLADASTERVGEFSIEGLDAATGDNALAIGKLAFGGFALPPRATLETALAALKNGGDLDLSSLVPALESVEADDIDVALDTMPRTSLDHLRLDLGPRVGTLPTTVKFDLAGADFDPALVPDPRPEAFARRFGFDRLHLDAGADISWGEDGVIAVRSFKFGAKGVGTLSGKASLTGPSPAAAACAIHSTGDLMAALSLKDATISFADDGAVAKGLAEQAQRVNRDPVQFRQQFAKGLPLLLTFIGNPDMQKQLAGALQTFITQPGTITFRLAPPAPVGLASLVETATTVPFSLLASLGVSISAVAGPAPPDAGDLRKSMTP